MRIFLEKMNKKTFIEGKTYTDWYVATITENGLGGNAYSSNIIPFPAGMTEREVRAAVLRHVITEGV